MVLVPAAPGEAPVGLGNTGDPIFNRMWTLLGVPCAALPVRWADNVRSGWGVRDFNWEYNAEIQHELRQGLSISGGYYFNNGGHNNLRVTIGPQLRF